MGGVAIENDRSGIFDLCVIGGGINGVGIAEDAAGRGLKVVLCEQSDLGSATSSSSSKLIHGGLRYLEHYEFGLVREALSERETLMQRAPHLVRPLTFILPYDPAQRPEWMIRIGLWLYDHLGHRRKLPASRHLNLRVAPEGEPLRNRDRGGFAYPDCRVDDARLVILVARSAAGRGAEIRTRTKVVAAGRADGHWRVQTRADSGAPQELRARILVNAAGPWVESVLEKELALTPKRRIRLVKGSHIVVPRVHTGAQAYLLQNTDGRIVFVIPYEEHFSLIGTTEKPYVGNPAEATIDEDEIDYLLDVANRNFTHETQRQDVVWSYAGVRPLDEDEASSLSEVSRGYSLMIDGKPEEPPLLSVYGGKLTTFRRLAENALEKLRPWLPHMAKPWTAAALLPGGLAGRGEPEVIAADLTRRYQWLPAALAARYSRAYGALASDVIGDAASFEAMGRHFGGSLYEREVEYLVLREWARSTEDVIWRRTKQGLWLTPEEVKNLEAWLAVQVPTASAA